MFGRLRSGARDRLTYANVMVTLLAFVVLGGVSFAAATIGPKDIKRNAVGPKQIRDGSVGEAELAAAAVTERVLADRSVSSSKLADGSVTQSKIADGAVSRAKVADAAVDGAKVADNSLTSAKLAEHWATVNQGTGVNASLLHGEGVTSVDEGQVDNGVTGVVFDRPVADCGVTANLGPDSSAVIPAPGFAFATKVPGDPANQIRVTTYNQAGTLTDLPFTVEMLCP
jgi:hypothetical protein